MYRKYIFFRVIYICSKCMKTSVETTDTNVRILISPFLVFRGKDWGKVLAVLLVFYLLFKRLTLANTVKCQYVLNLGGGYMNVLYTIFFFLYFGNFHNFTLKNLSIQNSRTFHWGIIYNN